MSRLAVRIICGVLAAVMVVAVVAKPPESSQQWLGALMPVGMLLAVALKGNRSSIIPRKRP